MVAGTLWLIPNNISFTCFCFTYCYSAPHLHSQFAYFKERGAGSISFAKISEDFPNFSNCHAKLKGFQKNLVLPFYKGEINHLWTLFPSTYRYILSRKGIFHFSSLKSHQQQTLTQEGSTRRTFQTNWDVCKPSFSSYPNSYQTTTKKHEFFKKLTSQELAIHKLQVFSWLSTFVPYKMSPAINDLRREVTANNLGKMQYFPIFDGMGIVSDQWPNKDK